MSTSAEEFVNGLLSKEALELPSDAVRSTELSFELPKWFDEEKFNKGRRFFWDYSYGFFMSIMMGHLGSIAVPSILQVLIGSQRSATPCATYKAYASTALHMISWFENELKPGSVSWKSLYAVRKGHIRAGLAGKLKGFGIVSQRDLALGQFGVISYAVLKPDKLGIRQMKEGDWDAYIHVWRVIGYMLGLQDRFNVCRETINETRQVCQILRENVFCPCLVSAPEYYEHMARSFVDGMKTFFPGVDVHSMLYFFRYLSDVPGYIYTETDRIELQKRLRMKLTGQTLSKGVEASALVPKPIGDSPSNHCLLYYNDYETFEATPAYKQLPMSSKIRLHVIAILLSLGSVYIVRLFLKLTFKFIVLTMRYCPDRVFSSFDFIASLIKPLVEGQVDYTKLKPNDKYYEEDKMI